MAKGRGLSPRMAALTSGESGPARGDNCSPDAGPCATLLPSTPAPKTFLLPNCNLSMSMLKTLAAGLLLLACTLPAPAQESAPKPTIFVLGDSTARNSGKGRSGEPVAGWGSPLAAYFDPAKVAVANVAHAGQSSRTYFNSAGDWPAVLSRMKAGDFVLLVFGLNDGGPPKAVESRGSIPGIGEETVALPRPDGTVETAHSYGWYLGTMAQAARAQGARVYFLTVTVRNIWTNPKVKFQDATPAGPLPADYDPKQDRIERGTGNGQYTQWTKEVGAKLRLPVADLTNLCADRYEKLGREAVDKLYSDHNHTYLPGAEIVAGAVVAGLKALPQSPFLSLLSEKGRAVETADAKYLSANAPAGAVR